MPSISKSLAALMLLLAAAAVRAADQDSEIALQRALDQPITLSLQGAPLSEAFKQIATNSKVPLQVDPSCYEYLPYGATTLVSVDFKQSKLRDSLDVLLMPIGLETVVASNTLMIRPSSPLRHIGRRADWEELKLLKELWNSPDLKAPANGPYNLADAIRAAMENRKDLTVPIPGEANGVLSQAQQQAMDQVGKQPMSAYRALEMYCRLTGNVWFVETGLTAGGSTGGKVVIMSPKAWINRQLDRPIQISRSGQPLEVIVNDLTNASGIRFVPEPGLYAAVPVVTLRSDNSTVRQTLEALAGATRIAFDVRDDSVLLRMAAGPGEAGPSKPDAIIGKITIPLGTEANAPSMDIYLHESDLTPEQNALRKQRLEQAVKTIVPALSPPPATIPAPPATATTPSTQAKGD
ncbi:MAG TPA: hypothetical protein VHM90_02505 [Phycisphaerae bacterium]|nr:hypothetical protein [Phycisphaerae bacterium]